MALPSFAKILFDPLVLDYVGGLPSDVADCLYGAFEDIRHRRLSLDPPSGGWRLPFSTRACQHVIYASLETASNTVVVLGVIADIDDGGEPL